MISQCWFSCSPLRVQPPSVEHFEPKKTWRSFSVRDTKRAGYVVLRLKAHTVVLFTALVMVAVLLGYSRAVAQSDMGTCAAFTNRWPLKAGVSNSVGSWSGTAYGGVSFSNGYAAFDSTGYIDLGSRTVGGAMSWAFWGRVEAYGYWERWFDWASGAPLNNLLLSPYGAIDGAPGTWHLSVQIVVGTNYNVPGLTIFTTTYLLPLHTWVRPSRFRGRPSGALSSVPSAPACRCTTR